MTTKRMDGPEDFSLALVTTRRASMSQVYVPEAHVHVPERHVYVPGTHVYAPERDLYMSQRRRVYDKRTT